MNICNACIHRDVCGLEDNNEGTKADMLALLDKISSEIKDSAFDWQEIDGEHESFMVVDLNDVLNILDKYKEESEDKE